MFNTMTRGLRRLAPSAAHARDARFYLRLPSPYGGKPWLTATFVVASVPRGYGETLRLRAHIDGCLPRPRGRGALPGDLQSPRSLAEHGRAVAAALARRALESLPTQPWQGKRWRSWLDIQFSSAPLDAGADALMPEPLRRLYPGPPQAGLGKPRIGVWVGPAGGAAGGIARLAMLQLDGRDRGGEAASGVNLNASLAQLTEPLLGDDESD